MTDSKELRRSNSEQSEWRPLMLIIAVFTVLALALAVFLHDSGKKRSVITMKEPYFVAEKITQASNGLSVLRGKVNSSFLCAVTAHGRLYCEGDNSYGQLGTGKVEIGGDRFDVESESYFQRVPIQEPVASVSTNSKEACAVAKSGALYCWGDFQPERHGWAKKSRPVRSPIKEKIASVSLGDDHGCAVSASKTLYCWGSDEEGQADPFSSGSEDYRSDRVVHAPLRIGEAGQYESVVAQGQHTCALKTDGQVSCWGEAYLHAEEQRGNVNHDLSLPSKAVALAKGNGNVCALLETARGSESRAYCWGNVSAVVDGDRVGTTFALKGLDRPVQFVPASFEAASIPDGLCFAAQKGKHLCVEIPVDLKPLRAKYAKGANGTPVRSKSAKAPGVRFDGVNGYVTKGGELYYDRKKLPLEVRSSLPDLAGTSKDGAYVLLGGPSTRGVEKERSVRDEYK